MADLNYLGMPMVVERVYDDTSAHLLIDPEKTSEEAKQIISSKWDEITKKPRPRKRAPAKRGKEEGDSAGSRTN